MDTIQTKLQMTIPSNKTFILNQILSLILHISSFHIIILKDKKTFRVCSVRHSFHCRIKSTDGKMFNRTFLTFPIRIYHFILIYLELLFRCFMRVQTRRRAEGKKI